MKKLLFLGFTFFLFSLASKAQSTDGKTYYDDAKTKPKEVYMYREVYTFGDDPSQAQTVQQKHGPYFYYFENGKLKISGNYNADKKDGEWKYYDEKGKLLKIENYKSGTLQEE